MSTSELAASYAALILADDGADITADKLQSIITAANIEGVEPILPTLFAKALEGKDIKDLLTEVSNQGGAAINPTATRDKNIAAYYLLLLGGNPSPSVEDVKSVVEAGGVTPDVKSLSKLDDYVLKPRASINRAVGKPKL